MECDTSVPLEAKFRLDEVMLGQVRLGWVRSDLILKRLRSPIDALFVN